MRGWVGGVGRGFVIDHDVTFTLLLPGGAGISGKSRSSFSGWPDEGRFCSSQPFFLRAVGAVQGLRMEHDFNRHNSCQLRGALSADLATRFALVRSLKKGRYV